MRCRDLKEFLTNHNPNDYTSIDLRGENIGHEGAKDLAEALKVNNGSISIPRIKLLYGR